MDINFEGFLGNKTLKETFQIWFKSQRLPQAIILQGAKGLGKSTVANLVAKIAVCTCDTKPCGVCSGCLKAKAGSHPDIRLETGSGASGNISVETVRSIIEDAYKKPDEADRRIFILDIKKTILSTSQNKLLKIIEEPPSNSLFIICIESAESLLPTIRSRSQCLSLNTVSFEESAEYCSNKLNIDFESALQLAKLHSGNIGEMLSENSLASTLAKNTAEIFNKSDEDSFLALCYPLIKDRDLFILYLDKLKDIFRDALMLNIGIKQTIGTYPEQSQILARHYRKAVLYKLPDLCTEYRGLVGRNINMNLLVTSFCANLREIVSV